MSWSYSNGNSSNRKTYRNNYPNTDAIVTNVASNRPSNSGGWIVNQDFNDWGISPETIRCVKRKELKTFDNPKTNEVAIDCEMVEGTSNYKRFSVLARVSIINSNLQPLLDTYVDPMCRVSDYRTAYSGILPEHLEGAPTYDDVRQHVINLLNNERILIGHDLKQDLDVLGIKNIPRYRLRDTSRCYLSYFKPNQKPSLKRLAEAVLGQTIQTGAHNSMEDARVAMILWKHWVTLDKDLEDAMPLEKKQKRNKKDVK